MHDKTKRKNQKTKLFVKQINSVNKKVSILINDYHEICL